MKATSDSRPWARATIAAAVATCALVVAQVLAERGRLELLDDFDLALPIILCSLLTGALLFVTWSHAAGGDGQRYARWLALLYAVGAVAFVVGLNQFTPVLAPRGIRNDVARMMNTSHLKQLMLALHNYAGANGDQLPGAAIRSPDGKPLLSWRVAILPFIEQDALYRLFHLDEPWDSPHNIKLLPQMPQIFQHHFPNRHQLTDQTFYQVFVGPGTPFESTGLRLPADIRDGTSNTLGIVEARTPVPWTKPADLDYDPNGPLPAIGAMLPGDRPRRYAIVALMDGSIRTIDLKISDATLRAAITRNGGETLGPDW